MSEPDEIERDEEDYPRDVKIDEVKVVLMDESFSKQDTVVYQRQVEVQYEKRFFSLDYSQGA